MNTPSEIIAVQCPTCGKSGKAPRKAAGRSVRCSVCGGTFSIPLPPDPSSSSPAGRVAEETARAPSEGWDRAPSQAAVPDVAAAGRGFSPPVQESSAPPVEDKPNDRVEDGEGANRGPDHAGRGRRLHEGFRALRARYAPLGKRLRRGMGDGSIPRHESSRQTRISRVFDALENGTVFRLLFAAVFVFVAGLGGIFSVAAVVAAFDGDWGLGLAFVFLGFPFVAAMAFVLLVRAVRIWRLEKQAMPLVAIIVHGIRAGAEVLALWFLYAGFILVIALSLLRGIEKERNSVGEQASEKHTLDSRLAQQEDGVQRRVEQIERALQHFGPASRSDASVIVGQLSEWSDGIARYEMKFGESGTATIDLESDEFDAVLVVVSPAERRVDDDGGGGRNSRLRIPVDTSGIYRVECRKHGQSSGAGSRGAFRLVVSGAKIGEVTVEGRPVRTERLQDKIEMQRIDLENEQRRLNAELSAFSAQRESLANELSQLAEERGRLDRSRDGISHFIGKYLFSLGNTGGLRSLSWNWDGGTGATLLLISTALGMALVVLIAGYLLAEILGAVSFLVRDLQAVRAVLEERGADPE